MGPKSHNSAVSLLLISDIMSIPNEALQKLIHEIESQALVAQQQIGLTKSQVASKQREQRLIKLTLGEVSSLPEDAVVYEGVGKMFASLPVDSLRQKLMSKGKTSRARSRNSTSACYI